MKKKFLLFIIVILPVILSAQKFENLGKTPQMGWNSWNTFGIDLNEEIVMEMADAMINLGLKDAGYEYILLDDGWMAKERDEQGNFIPNPTKFPNGIKALADYVHAKGLKLGLYSCAGDKTCGNYPGSRGHEYQDALKFAEWGVDYLKYDWCYAGEMNAKEAYTTMRDALYAAKRPVFFSICEWGDNQPWDWAKEVGHSWRITGDIYNCFDCAEETGWGVVQIVNMRDHDKLRKAAGPGHWNDMDMLEIGNGGMTYFEEQTHFALWAILSSPLILGNDLRKIKKETLDILRNKNVIAVNQDPLGIQGFKYTTIHDNVEVWVKQLDKGELSVCFFNRSENPIDLSFDWNAHVIKDDLYDFKISFAKNNVYRIKDLFLNEEIGKTDKVLTKKLGKNQSLLVRLYR